MNVDKYFIKKYIPIYKTGSKICIGYVGTKEYIEVIYNTFYNKLLYEILNKYREEVSEYNYNNQPYNFTYFDFIKLNLLNNA